MKTLMPSIDINADIGESFGNWSFGNDSLILDYVSSANIACGFHAGDPVVMRDTVRMAVAKNVSIGAHPGYPDLQGFGRRSIKLSSKEIYSYVLYQLGALKVITESEGGRMNHVKAHGALYNDAAASSEIAEAIVSACFAIDKNLIIFGLPNSEIENAALRKGMRFSLEAFADRAYLGNGSLVSRRENGSVLSDPDEIVKRVLRMVIDNRLTCFDGGTLIIRPDTICIHGDNLHAIEIAKAIKKGLNEDGINIKSLSGE